MDSREPGTGSLTVLVLIVSLLMACFFMWLLLSSCLGDSIIQQLRELWDSALRSARLEDTVGPRGLRSSGARRRRELGFSEGDTGLWEMEALGARRGG